MATLGAFPNAVKVFGPCRGRPTGGKVKGSLFTLFGRVGLVGLDSKLFTGLKKDFLVERDWFWLENWTFNYINS